MSSSSSRTTVRGAGTGGKAGALRGAGNDAGAGAAADAMEPSDATSSIVGGHGIQRPP